MKVFLLFMMVMIGSFLLPASEVKANQDSSHSSSASNPGITCHSIKNEGAEFVSGKKCVLSTGEQIDSVLLPKALVGKISLVKN